MTYLGFKKENTKKKQNVIYEEFWKNTNDIQEFKEPFIKILFEEVNMLLKEYTWKWNEEDLCFYNENGDDVTDAAYYDCDGLLCHPKLLATYVNNFLESKKRYIEKHGD